MENIYTKDWHIHTEGSYDATLPFKELVTKAKENGITQYGVTDHVNYPFMKVYLQKSRDLYEQYKTEGFHFGVELTTMSKAHLDYAGSQNFDMTTVLRSGLVPGFVHKGADGQGPVDFALTEEELRFYKVEYVIAAAHWLFDCPLDRKSVIRNWHEQQMYCATDSRVDIVGHPWWLPWNPDLKNWYNDEGIVCGEPWFDDFGVIPQSMHEEFAAALLENGKCAEMNLSFFTSKKYTDIFKHQYTEYIRMLFEKGIPITIGSDSHHHYENIREKCAEYLIPAGFKADDFAAPTFRRYE